MLPPLSADGYADKSAPFSKWQTYGTYAERADCNAQIASFQFAVNAQVGQISHADDTVGSGSRSNDECGMHRIR
jgi:hypothetical protein